MNTNYDKLPPQALDLEEAVLGAMLIEKEAATVIFEILTPNCFYKQSHRDLFLAMSNLSQKSEPIDILTVNNSTEVRSKRSYTPL